MKKSKLLSVILLTSMLCLSGCSLFNDDDIAVKNSYNPHTSEPQEDPNATYVNGVKGVEKDEVSQAFCFKNVPYAVNDKIINTYKEGGENHVEYNVNNGQDYEANKSSNNYDLYVPHLAPRDDTHKVILFIHGGAWVSGFKTDVNPYVYEFANRGYITATIKYTLLKRTMDNPSLSIFRNLDEIDACIASIKSALEQLSFDTTKTQIVIGGASSGAHLAMLYSYSRGHKSPIPIKFVVDAVGPVDIKSDGWKCFSNASNEVLDAGIQKDAIQTQKDNGNLSSLSIAGEKDEGGNAVYWNDYQTLRIANGMCGLPYTLEDIAATTDESKQNIVHPNAASNSMTKDDGGQDQLSVTYWINKGINNYGIISAYAGKDSIVGIAQYARLQAALESKVINHQFFYFKNSDHTEITAEKDPTAYGDFIDKIAYWLSF